MNEKMGAKFDGLFRRPLTDDQESFVLIALIQRLVDKFGQQGAAKALNVVLSSLSQQTNP